MEGRAGSSVAHGGGDETASHRSVSFVIATYNRRPLIESQAPHILSMSSCADVIVIDDGSEDGTFPVLERELGGRPGVLLLRNRTNQGSSYCWNLGIANARSPYLIFLPDDAEIADPEVSRFVSTLLRRISERRIVGLRVIDRTESANPVAHSRMLSYLAPAILYFLAAQVIPPTHDRSGRCSFVSGAMAIPTKVGLDVLFDEASFPGTAFREEADFQLRARRTGIEVFYEPSLAIYHKEATVGGHHSPAREWPHREYWAVRNHARFVRKNFGTTWPLKLAFFLFYAATVRRAPIRMIAWGVRDGCSGALPAKEGL